MTDRGWKAAPTNWIVLEYWSGGVMEIANYKQQISNKKTMTKFKKDIGKKSNLLLLHALCPMPYANLLTPDT